MRIAKFVAIALSLTMLSSSAHAILFCSEPSPPYCIDSYGTFDNDWSFRSCKSEVENYLANVERYLDCLDSEKLETSRKANEVVERFNCKARGDSFCF